MRSPTLKTLRSVGSLTLCQLENCFAACIPAHLFPKAASHQNSRDRDYTRWLTFWCMLWQGFNPLASGREVVRQLQALFELENRRPLSPQDGAYCRAKARLSLEQFPQVLCATSRAADRLAPAPSLLRGRPIKVVDGSTFTLPDTPKNRIAYPKVTCGNFPMMRFVALFSLLGGAVTAVAQGAWGISELGLLHSLAAELKPGDILLGDRGFGSYPVVAWLQHFVKSDFVGRTTRRIDARKRIKRLARNDYLIRWKKNHSCPSPWLTAQERTDLPAEMTLRMVKGSCYQKGFRVRQVTVITTLLDPELYPAQEILQTYLRRWRMEMCLDDLKTTLQMDGLRSRSPKMVCREMYTRLIVHNLIRCTMAQAASEHRVPLDRLSFKGSLDGLRHFSQAFARARSKAKRRQLWDLLLRTIAADEVPYRPRRREPRAIKRKKNRYPRLTSSRTRFRDNPKRNQRAKIARLCRRLALM